MTDIAKKEAKRVKKVILEESYETDVIDELYNLTKYINGDHDAKTVNVFFKDFNYEDCKKVRRFLKKKLLNKLECKELSFLQTMRIVKALDAMEAVKKIEVSDNPKLEFCVETHRLNDEYPLEIIALLDQ